MIRIFLFVALFSAAFSDFGPKRKVIESEQSLVRCDQYGPNAIQHQYILTPEQIEGPYYVDDATVRSNINEGKPGIPVDLKLTLTDATNCQPIANATIDIWHCDHLGYYSGHLDISPDVPPPPVEHVDPTDPSRFLRGIQYTDSKGVVRFQTIYPGWYYGRSVHIHVLVHIGGKVVYTSQIYFPEVASEQIELLPPYSDHKTRRTPNEEDWPYAEQRGQQLLLDPRLNNYKDISEGLTAEYVFGVNPKHAGL